MSDSKRIVLTKKHDQLVASIDGAEEKPVTVAWVRPVSGRGAEVSILDKDKKEMVMLSSLDVLEPDSRRIAEAELAIRYMIPLVSRVFRTEAHFGNLYWHVATDRGEKKFLMRDPNANVTWLTDDKLVLRDQQGHRYEIPSYSGLDPKSRAEVDRIV